MAVITYILHLEIEPSYLMWSACLLMMQLFLHHLDRVQRAAVVYQQTGSDFDLTIGIPKYKLGYVKGGSTAFKVTMS